MRTIRYVIPLFVVFFYLSPPLDSQASTTQVDSLEAELQKVDNPAQRSSIYEQLAQVNRHSDSEAALYNGRKMLNIEHNESSSHRLSDAYALMGDLYYQYGLYDSSRYYTQLNVDLLKRNPQFPQHSRKLLDATTRLGIISPLNQQIIILKEALALDSITSMDSAIIYNTLGNALYAETRYDESLSCFDFTINYARKTANKRLEAMGLNNASEPLSTQGRYELAEEYIVRARQLAEELGESVGIIHCTRSLAFLYSDMGEQKKAATTMREAILKSKEINHPFLTGLCINSLLYFQDSTMAEDPELLNWANNMLDPSHPEYVEDRTGVHSALAYYHSATEDHKKAAFHAERGLAGLRAAKQDSTIDYIVNLEVLATAQEKTGRYREAAENLRKSADLRKAQEAKREAASFAQTAVEMELAENELARQQAEAETALERQASAAQTRLFGLGALAAALILGIIVWAYLRSRRDAQRISTQKALVDQSLSEKDVLLREIHHRVKNNLQIISTLLQKQARQSDSEDLKEMIRDGQERIQSMALIHENLYRSEQLSGVSIKQYLKDLTDSVKKSQGVSKVAVDLKVEDEHLDIDTAIPLGLILNELITNAYKYAFPDNRQGAITVEFEKQKDGQYLLRVSDDGVGLPSDHEVRQRNSLGLNLVKGLVGQLEGSIDWIKRESGTSVAILF